MEADAGDGLLVHEATVEVAHHDNCQVFVCHERRRAKKKWTDDELRMWMNRPVLGMFRE